MVTIRRGAVAAVLAVACVSATFAACPASAADNESRLLREVPRAFRSTCTAEDHEDARGAIAQVSCEPKNRVNRVVYTMFKTPGSANRYFVRARAAAGIDADTNADCAALSDSESPYRTKTGATGRVFCSTHRGQTISWTDQQIVATATGHDDHALYAWWARLVGRTLNPTQQALLKEIPGGIERSSCADNGDASIKCGYLTEEIFAVRYTRYPDAATLAEAYGSRVDKEGLASDTAPPQTAFGSCSFETNWGKADSSGVITQPMGRLACFEKDFLPTLLWTQDERLILTEVEGDTTASLGSFFQSYATAQPPATSS